MSLSFDHLNLRVEKPTGAKDKRAALLQDFLERLNPSRVAAGYKAYTPSRLGFKLAHLSYQDLDALWKSCERYNGPFSKAFEGSLKVKK